MTAFPGFRLGAAAAGSALLLSSLGRAGLPDPSRGSPSTAHPLAPVEEPVLAPEFEPLIVPRGTHLPLVLQNGLNSSSAKAGDAVYFESSYPIGVRNRMAIPVGTFLRGRITEAKRPGRIRGRGEFRILLTEITFSNGYTVSLVATPSSVEMNGKVKVDGNGKITGPGGRGRDARTLALATLAGGPVGGYAGLLAGNVDGKNLAIGHGAGAAAGLLLVLLTRGPEAELPRGSLIDFEFIQPLALDPAQLPRAGDAPKNLSPRTGAAPADRSRRPGGRRKIGGGRLPVWPLLFSPR